jgi:hypothetical protein
MSFTKITRLPRVALAIVTTVAGGCAGTVDEAATVLVRDGGTGRADEQTPVSRGADSGGVADVAPDASAASEAARDAPADARLPDGPAAPPAVAAPGDCHRDEDCRLVNDCCSCAAVARGQADPACDPAKSCLMTTCAQYGGIDRPRCLAGRCIVGFACDTSDVTCKRAPPVCPAGQTPLVVGTGAQKCYGECVDAEQCAAVPACSACAPDDLCVHTPAIEEATHCVPWPQACAGPASCSCASAACVAPFASCADAEPGTSGVICTP